MNKTTLKARFGSDIRKNWIHHTNDISLNDLVTKMQRYFDIKDASGIKLKYRDQENDWVSLVDDDDLAYALASMELLYVDVLIEEQLKTQKEEAIEKIATLIDGEKAAVGPPREVTPVDSVIGSDAVQQQKQQRASTTPLSSIGELTEIPLNGPNKAPFTQPPTTGGGAFYGQMSQQQQNNVSGIAPLPQQQQISSSVVSPLPPPPITSMSGDVYHQYNQQQPFSGAVPTTVHQQPQQAPFSPPQQAPFAPPQQAPFAQPPVSGGGMFYGQPQQQQQNNASVIAPPPPLPITSVSGDVYHQYSQQQPFSGAVPTTVPPQPQQTPFPPPPISAGGMFYGQNPFSRQNR